MPKRPRLPERASRNANISRYRAAPAHPRIIALGAARDSRPSKSALTTRYIYVGIGRNTTLGLPPREAIGVGVGGISYRRSAAGGGAQA